MTDDPRDTDPDADVQGEPDDPDVPALPDNDPVPTEDK